MTYAAESTDPAIDPAISIVVPTYREAENIPYLIDRIESMLRENHLDAELLILDDNSPDRTADVVRELARPWVRLIVRTKDRGLGPAVVDGMRAARAKTLVVMDADLSHPPEKVPEMLTALDKGFQFVIGSRYVHGSSTDESWGALRWINSKVATLLARPFTNVRDPMSGFLALRRETFQQADYLNPVGYKIGLELLVKCRVETVHEVPIHFANRKYGESKLTLIEQLKYLQHLRRLFIYKYFEWTHLPQFIVIGASGVILNM
ncbi:MAG: polyprenol monophosphomannose synthase, partial [Candidatus Hydrogenedentota bacterium]